jgi:hypothetical protein
MDPAAYKPSLRTICLPHPQIVELKRSCQLPRPTLRRNTYSDRDVVVWASIRRLVPPKRVPKKSIRLRSKYSGSSNPEIRPSTSRYRIKSRPDSTAAQGMNVEYGVDSLIVDGGFGDVEPPAYMAMVSEVSTKCKLASLFSALFRLSSSFSKSNMQVLFSVSRGH